ncbi:MAG: hypothetical protein ABW133_23675, partial [Polyangiaceae bacterium]
MDTALGLPTALPAPLLRQGDSRYEERDAIVLLAIGFPPKSGVMLSRMRGHQSRLEPGFDDLVGLVRDLPQGRRGQIVNCKLHLSHTCQAAHAHTLAELSATLLA